jgi:hypothetical protein
MTPTAPFPNPPQPARRKTPVWVWVLTGIAGFIVLLVLLLVAGGVWMANKAVNMLDNPKELAGFVEKLNPDLEVLDADKEKRLIRVRDKHKDETYTVRLDGLTSGKLRLERESKADGVEVIDIGQPFDTPNWVPMYPGVTPKPLGQARSDKRGEGGIVEFRTEDAPEKVRAFFKEAAAKKGLNPSTSPDAGKNADHYVSEDGTLHLAIEVSTMMGSSRVHVAFGEKKK